MPDREKVIKAIDACMDQFHPAYCNECYLDGPGFGIVCRETLMRDALALLREQEPVEPVPEHPVVINTLACGVCHAQVARWDMFPRMSRDAKRVYLFKAKYCPECGRKVKWDE